MLRTLDPTPFTAMALDPDIRPWLGFETEDVEVIEKVIIGLVSNPENFCFLTKEGDGGYILIKANPGLYIAHSLSLPPARGRPMLKAMRDGFATMFMASDAIEITTMVPDGHEAAAKWAQIAGFRPTYRREAFFSLNGERIGGQFMSLLYQDWVLRNAMCLNLGQLVHEKLEEASGEKSHPDDEVHDRWVGATMGACIEGNLEKGIGLYNRYAVVAGYQPCSILSAHPPVVDIGSAIVQLLSGAMDVLHVRAKPSV